MRKWSSVMPFSPDSATTVLESAETCSIKWAISFSLLRKTFSRRIRSSARFFATCVIHADGFLGMPGLQRPGQGFLPHVFGPLQVFDAEGPGVRRDHFARRVTSNI